MYSLLALLVELLPSDLDVCSKRYNRSVPPTETVPCNCDDPDHSARTHVDRLDIVDVNLVMDSDRDMDMDRDRDVGPGNAESSSSRSRQVQSLSNVDL